MEEKIDPNRLIYSKVNQEFSDILRGAGWCTDEYIWESNTELSAREMYVLMIKLASDYLLYPEDAVDMDYLENKPKIEYAITLDELKMRYPNQRVED